MTEIESNNEDEGEEGLSLVQRVAIVMLALGEETSGEVMKYLTDREVEEITEALATLKNVSADVMDQVLENHLHLLRHLHIHNYLPFIISYFQEFRLSHISLNTSPTTSLINFLIILK